MAKWVKLRPNKGYIEDKYRLPIGLNVFLSPLLFLLYPTIYIRLYIYWLYMYIYRYIYVYIYRISGCDLIVECRVMTRCIHTLPTGKILSRIWWWCNIAFNYTHVCCSCDLFFLFFVFFYSFKLFLIQNGA